MRWFCLFVVIILSILEITPIPVTGLLLMWIILFRPPWFYELVIKIYRNR